ncbi:hypothetical protein Tco_1328903 [Tanacetum coccineum]
MKATMAWRCRACDDLVKDYLCVPLTPIVISAAQSKNGGVTEWYQEPKIIMAKWMKTRTQKRKNLRKKKKTKKKRYSDIDNEEDENEPELTFPYEEADPLNPPPHASDLEHEDVIEVDDTVEPKDEIVPASVHEVGESSTASFYKEISDGMLPSLMRRDINFLFGRMTSLSR